MSSAGRRTSFRPGRSSITGRVAAAVITATAWSRVIDLDGRPKRPARPEGQTDAAAAALRATIAALAGPAEPGRACQGRLHRGWGLAAGVSAG